LKLQTSAAQAHRSAYSVMLFSAQQQRGDRLHQDAEQQAQNAGQNDDIVLIAT
jgi:hypothetical protein